MSASENGVSSIQTKGELQLKVFASLTDAFGLRVDADAADDKFIVAAVEGEASYIVSGDLHLKDIGEYQGIKIISPTEFLRIISERG